MIGPWEGEGLRFAAHVKVAAEGGKVVAQGDKISVTDADAVTLCYVAATSYVNYQDVSGDPLKKVDDYLAGVRGKSFEQLSQRHIDDYSELFGRVAIDLGGKGANENLPTDERLKRVTEGSADPLLAEQLFQYGRYLMIAGSRPGTQPLNLQGIWNDKINPPWGSKYTININIQMNYWVAEVCNLSECHEPLLRMVGELQAPGRNTAKVHYRAGGWVAHHNTDLWRGTAPVDGAQWGMWPTGGAWLCQHLWEHYLYTGDTEHLKKSYPILKGAVEFFLDVLVENEDGHLITSPSLSPEHSHGGGTKDGLSVGRAGTSVCCRAHHRYADPTRSICELHCGIGDFGHRRRLSVAGGENASASGAHEDRSAWPASGMAGGLGQSRGSAQPRLAPLWTVSKQPDQSSRHPKAVRSGPDVTDPTGGRWRMAWRMENLLVGSCGRW